LIEAYCGEMATVYESRTVGGNEEWRFRTKILVKDGKALHKYSPYLWSSKDSATRDEPLFRYLHDRFRISPVGRPKIPSPPHGDEWFVSILPNDSWQPIREYLLSLVNIVTPPSDSIKKRKYQNRAGAIGASITKCYRKRDQKATGVLVVQEESSIEMVVDTAASKVTSSTSASLPSVQVAPDKLSSSTALANYIESKDAGKMRKTFGELKPRRQAFLQNVLVDAVKGIWKEFSHKNSLRELQECLVNTELDFDSNSLAVIGIRNSYQIALKNNNKCLMEQILSMFCLNKEMTITKLSNLMGLVISYSMYRNASHHAQTYGPGAIVVAAASHRNVELKYEIIEALVEYCIEQGTLKVMWNIIPL
jgi:hypothetical protein